MSKYTSVQYIFVYCVVNIQRCLCTNEPQTVDGSWKQKPMNRKQITARRQSSRRDRPGLVDNQTTAMTRQYSSVRSVNSARIYDCCCRKRQTTTSYRQMWLDVCLAAALICWLCHLISASMTCTASTSFNKLTAAPGEPGFIS